MFAIIKSYVYFLYEKKAVYAVVGNPLRAQKDITKKEALEIIREKGLVCTHENEHGKIWETPDRA